MPEAPQGPQSERPDRNPVDLPSGPPTADDVAAAVARLTEAAMSRPRSSQIPLMKCCLHLALPVAEVPTTSVRHMMGRYFYRDVILAPAQDPFETAVRLASAGHQSADRYLDLSSDARPSCWIKVLPDHERSGLKAFGTDYLFPGLPEVSFSFSTPWPLVESFLDLITAEGEPETPGVCTLDEGTVLVSRINGRLEVVPDGR